jgi:predicted dehydrogenase
MSHFCRVIRREETPRTTARDARKTLEGVMAIMRSRDTGQAVELK